MRKFFFLPVMVSVAVLVACNSSTDGTADTTDTMQHMDTAHGNMNMTDVPPVPDIPAGAKVYFANLQDGQTVTSPVKVEMAVDGMKVDSAGALRPNSGHHHLFIDGSSLSKGQVVPKDSTHLHFGNAQTEATIPLPPGQHTLTLQFADGMHRSYGEELSKTISVTVKQ